MTYHVIEEDEMFYVVDEQGKAVANYCDRLQALKEAQRRNHAYLNATFDIRSVS